MISEKLGDIGNTVKETEPDLDREDILKRELTPAQYEDIADIVECIKKIGRDPEYNEKLGRGTASMIDNASINVGADKSSVVLTFDHSPKGDMGYLHYSDGKTMDILKEIVGDMTGKSCDITCRQLGDVKETDVHTINLSKINMVVREED